MPVTEDPRAAARIRQLLSERDTALSQEMTERVKGIDKELAAYGYTGRKIRQTSSAAPEGRQAPAKETAEEPVKRGPGRPPGSKNKPKDEA